MRDPVLHTHVEDILPSGHPLAFQHISCDGPKCGKLLHSANNECMQSWIETGMGNYCLPCFEMLTEGAADIWWGLPESDYDKRVIQSAGATG